MSAEKIVLKLSKPLAEFLRSNGPDILKWFMEKDTEYKTKLIESEEVLDAFWESFQKNGPHDKEIFSYLINETSKEQREKVIELLSSLILSKDKNQYSTLLSMFIENKDDLPKKMVKTFQEDLLEISPDIPYPDNIELLEGLAKSYGKYDSSELESITTKILPLISDNNVQIVTDVYRVINTINDKLNRFGNQIGVNESINRTKELFEANNANLQPHLDFLSLNSAKFTFDQKNEIIEMFKNQIKLEKPNNIRLFALKFILKLDAYDRKPLLKEVIELAKKAPEPDTKNMCKEILISSKPQLLTSQEKIVKSIFGDEVFK